MRNGKGCLGVGSARVKGMKTSGTEDLAEEFQAACLPVPVGFEFGVGGAFRIRAGDGYKETLRIGEFRGVFLKIAAETAPEKVPVVGFLGSSFAGYKSRLDGWQGRICQRR